MAGYRSLNQNCGYQAGTNPLIAHRASDLGVTTTTYNFTDNYVIIVVRGATKEKYKALWEY